LENQLRFVPYFSIPLLQSDLIQVDVENCVRRHRLKYIINDKSGPQLVALLLMVVPRENVAIHHTAVDDK